MMTNKIPNNGEIISSFWRNKNINKLISAQTTTDLLFSKYRKAFNKAGSNVGFLPNIKWKDNYGSHKGEWLNEQLAK